MKIVQARYARADNLQVLVVLENGEDWLIPQPCETGHQVPLQRFLDDGGVIEPYEPPPEVEQPEPYDVQLDKIRSRLDALNGGTTVRHTR